MSIKGTGALHSGGDPDLPPDLRTDPPCPDMKRARCVSRRGGLIFSGRGRARWCGPGDTQRSYSYYERGDHMIPPEILCRLADYYHTSVDYLLGRTNDPTPYPKK